MKYMMASSPRLDHAGPYVLQAPIAACHATAAGPADARELRTPPTSSSWGGPAS